MSAKKEKVALQRGDDFDAVDAELTEALAQLEEANTSVVHVLEGDDEEEVVEGEAVIEEASNDEAVAVVDEIASDVGEGEGETGDA